MCMFERFAMCGALGRTRLRFLPSRMGCDKKEMDVMGDFVQVSRVVRAS